jgi:hypothetical protein
MAPGNGAISFQVSALLYAGKGRLPIANAAVVAHLDRVLRKLQSRLSQMTTVFTIRQEPTGLWIVDRDGMPLIKHDSAAAAIRDPIVKASALDPFRPVASGRFRDG